MVRSIQEEFDIIISLFEEKQRELEDIKKSRKFLTAAFIVILSIITIILILK